MIDQLISARAAAPGNTKSLAELGKELLKADPLDLVLYQEQVWDRYKVARNANIGTGGKARNFLIDQGEYDPVAPTTPGAPPWYHLGYSYSLENTRMMQIFARVVKLYRTGEEMGIPSLETQAWLDATEALIFNAGIPISAWLSTSSVRNDPEDVRRNAYWRLFGLDLAFGGDSNEPSQYVKAKAANSNFRPLFEELLHELWRSFENQNNTSGATQADPDRVYRIAQELGYVLRSRRQNLTLDREELSAATALGWINLTLQFNSRIMVDLKVEATSAAERLRLIGEKVGLPAHSRSAALISMAPDLSLLLRVIEAGVISSPADVPVLFLSNKPTSWSASSPQPIGTSVRRVITEWAAASGKDLKSRSKPVEVGAKVLTAA
ncbi:MAG: hypothetical protein QNJ15_13255 [Erythrobacter sp.]|nr:hypothetical protein [Erythrobacter sp.]